MIKLGQDHTVLTNAVGQSTSAMIQAAEASVVALAMLGDDAAFEELVRRRQSALRNLLRRLCRDHALADDLSQQTFLQAWKTLASLQSPMTFGAWLRQIAVNTWLQQVRRRDVLHTVLDDAHAEQAVYDTRSERIDLDDALSKLPDIVRLCVVLGYGEGMSHGEVANATGLPLGTVKSHITRGTNTLRELLHAYR